MRELITTFGYIPYLTTKSTGRQLINNAIMKSYIAALMALPQDASLAMVDVLDRALERFMGAGVDEAIRTDASLYQVNMTTVLTALLFDAHVRRHTEPGLHAAGD